MFWICLRRCRSYSLYTIYLGPQIPFPYTVALIRSVIHRRQSLFLCTFQSLDFLQKSCYLLIFLFRLPERLRCRL